MIKTLYKTTLLFILFSNIVSAENIENYLGLYKVNESVCFVQKGAYNPCDHTLFIEIVKGKFEGIESDELAIIFGVES